MILVITELTLPIAAALALNQLYVSNAKNLLKQNFKIILYTVGGFFLLLGLLYFSMEYSSGFDKMISDNLKSRGGNDDIIRATISGLKEDRSAMFSGQILRSLLFAILVVGLIWLYIKDILKKPVIIVLILGFVNIVDLLIVDRQYLNDDSYKPKEELQTDRIVKTPADELILKDKDPDYRVFNVAGFQDTHTSLFHKALGGYHPAKLRIYQDIIERYFSSSPNQQVLNMLNTKYIITQNPQNGQEMVIPNAQAYGSCWLVKNVKIVKDNVEEIQAIGVTNLNDTAVVQQSFAANVVQPQWDSTATVTLTKFDNDTLEYSTDSHSPQFAVFSEIYYPFGWNAYLDGKKVDYIKTDYALRGLSVPAGKHIVKFIFEPSSYKKGVTIGYAASWLIILLVLGGFFMAWRQSGKKV